jgi:hypothetical protein
MPQIRFSSAALNDLQRLRDFCASGIRSQQNGRPLPSLKPFNYWASIRRLAGQPKKWTSSTAIAD